VLDGPQWRKDEHDSGPVQADAVPFVGSRGARLRGGAWTAGDEAAFAARLELPQVPPTMRPLFRP